MVDHADASGEIGLLVIGGGGAAASAAKSYREAGGAGRVVLVSEDHALPYDRPPLSKGFLRGDLDEADLSILSTEDYRELEIEVMLATSAVSIDRVNRHVELSGAEQLSYDKCVIATGSSPQSLPVHGGDHPLVVMLRSLADARRLRSAAQKAGTAIVIGSGFIGCEAAASLAHRGLSVVLVSHEKAPQLNRLGPEAAARLKMWLEDEGVRLVLGVDVAQIVDGRTVSIRGGETINADLILTAVGVAPRSELGRRAGLGLGQHRIRVDARMRTSTQGLYAAGDVAYAYNTAARRHLTVEHWGEAWTMGEIAGQNAAGVPAEWSNAPGFWSTIGERTIKYAAWGDGFDVAKLIDHGDGAFTVWYGREGATVGVLAYERDDDYERGIDLVERGEPLPV